MARNPPHSVTDGELRCIFLRNVPLRGTGHFGGREFHGAAWRASPWVQARPVVTAPRISPGEEYGRIGISVPASPCSQLGSYLVSFFMGDKEGIDLFVQVPLVQ